MAGAGYRDFVAGAVLTAAQVDTYLMEQTCMVFASAAARDTALSTAKSEGMMAYLLDVNKMTIYSGAAWSTVGPVHGQASSWSPTVTQSSTITHSDAWSGYWRVGRLVVATYLGTLTSAGSAGNDITMTLPVACAQGAGSAVGFGMYFDSGVGDYLSIARITSSTTVKLYALNGGTNLLGILGSASNLNFAVANGDIISYTFTYEANADA